MRWESRIDNDRMLFPEEVLVIICYFNYCIWLKTPPRIKVYKYCDNEKYNKIDCPTK